MTTEVPQCYRCTHYAEKAYHKCAAFDAIPLDIWINNVLHTKPYPGDHGILFEAEKQ